MSFARAINSSITWTLSVVVLPQGVVEPLAQLAGDEEVGPLARPDLSREQPAQRFDGQTLLFCLADLGKKLLGKNRQARLIETGGSEHVENAVRHHSAREQLAKLLLDTCSTAPSARRIFDQVGA